MPSLRPDCQDRPEEKYLPDEKKPGIKPDIHQQDWNRNEKQQESFEPEPRTAESAVKKQIDLSNAHLLRGDGDSLPLTRTIRLKDAGSTPTAYELVTSVGGSTLWAFCDGNQTHLPLPSAR